MTLPWPLPAPTADAAATAAARAQSTLAHMAATVAVASGLAASGRPVDLAGLDEAAGLLCAQVLDLRPEDGAAIRPAMQALDARVAALMGTLRAAMPQAAPVPITRPRKRTP